MKVSHMLPCVCVRCGLPLLVLHCITSLQQYSQGRASFLSIESQGNLTRLHPRNYTLLATTTITGSVCFSVFNEICASDLRPPHTSEGVFLWVWVTWPGCLPAMLHKEASVLNLAVVHWYKNKICLLLFFFLLSFMALNQWSELWMCIEAANGTK